MARKKMMAPQMPLGKSGGAQITMADLIKGKSRKGLMPVSKPPKSRKRKTVRNPRQMAMVR